MDAVREGVPEGVGVCVEVDVIDAVGEDVPEGVGVPERVDVCVGLADTVEEKETTELLLPEFEGDEEAERRLEWLLDVVGVMVGFCAVFEMDADGVNDGRVVSVHPELHVMRGLSLGFDDIEADRSELFVGLPVVLVCPEADTDALELSDALKEL